MEYVLYSVGAVITVLLVAGFCLMVKLESAHARRTNCRCCKTKLRSEGGFLVPFLGRGFCPRCATYLMRSRKRA